MNKVNPLISVIVPVYNVEKYLERCLESIVKQNYNNYEVIIINDGSTDNSQNIIETYALKYTMINAYSRENKGLLYTRVDGVNKAKGKYIMFVDSDDWLENNALRVFANEIDKYDYDIIRANYNIFLGEKIQKVNDLKQDVISKEQLNQKLYKKLMTTDSFNNVWRQVIKKEIIDIDSIDTTICMGEDIIFNLACYKNVNNMKILNDNVYNYRINSSSINQTISTKRLTNNIEDLFKVYKKLTQEMILLKNKENIKLAYIRYLKKANYALLRLVCNCNDNELISKKIDEVFEKDITKEARKIIRIINILKLKEFIFIFLILKENKKIYSKLLILLKMIYNNKK